MTKRAEQIASTIDRAIREIFARGLQDPRIRGLITILNVRVTDDLREAHVRVSVLPREQQELTMHGLKAAARHIRHELSDMIAMRQTPELIFRLDESLKKQADIISVLAKVTAEREEREAGRPAADGEQSPEQERPA